METTEKVTTLESLSKLCKSTRVVRFNYCDQDCEFKMRCLTPAEQAQLAEMVDLVKPKLLRGTTPDLDRIDTLDTDYIKRKNTVAAQARAVGIYWAYEAINTSRPGMTDPAIIREYIEGQFSEDIMQVLWEAVQRSGVKFGELISFF